MLIRHVAYLHDVLLRTAPRRGIELEVRLEVWPAWRPAPPPPNPTSQYYNALQFINKHINTSYYITQPT